MALDIDQLSRACSAGPVVRVLIAEHKGSSPRETGTSMIVTQSLTIGTIGGGALEFSAIKMARSLLKSNGKAFSEKIPLGPNLGQCCGGAVTLVYERFDQTDLPNDQDSFIRAIGEKAQSLKVRKALKEWRNGKACDSITLVDGWLFERIKQPLCPVWIYGAGHVGRALVETFSGLPFEVTWIDIHDNRFPDEIPQTVTKISVEDPSQIVKHAPTNAQHLVLTFSHELDLALCHAILQHPFGSLGLIGSKSKRARFLKRLSTLGHSEVDLSRLNCPIGDRSLGKEPKAIALGVATELLADQRTTSRNYNYG